MKRIEKRVSPKALEPHPLEKQVLGEVELKDDFVASVRDVGILEPIVVAQLPGKPEHFVIISGHQRWRAAIELGLNEVPVSILQGLTDDEIAEAWAEANRRVKWTTEQKARWYRIIREQEQRRARERQSTLNNDTDLQETFPEAPTGQARDVAASQVGWSGKTADSAVKVIDAIDEAEEAGDTEHANELRETLETQGVAPATRKAGATRPKKTSGSKKNEPVDGLSLPVPPELREHHETVTHIRGLVQNIGKLKKPIEELESRPGGFFVRVNRAIQSLEQAQCELKHAVMHTHCPDCNRDGSQCATCKGAGFIPKSMWESGVSDLTRRKLGC